ncbi:MAG: hypothetical protein IPM04_14290 [Saprospiraceae bacterium]|nr:hypothetical protein [Candidatus Brachybacter algidus]MBK8748955.1 hypothetical protein [Candidatus Brachybacter algidus]
MISTTITGGSVMDGRNNKIIAKLVGDGEEVCTCRKVSNGFGCIQFCDSARSGKPIAGLLPI